MERYKRTRKIKKEIQGVTMLALVVTIIVLLILAAITLNLAVGENGIIARAKLARDKAKNASIGEEEAMNAASGEIDNAGNGGSGGGTCPECPDTKPLEDRIKELESQVGALQQQLETEKANKAELEKQIADLNKQIADLNAQIESQKEQIADLQGQLSSKNQELAKKDETIRNLQETVDRLNNQIEELNRQIETLKAKQATGNALVSEVLAGKTFSNSSGVGLVGTMANRAGQIVAWSGYETISVQPHPDDNSQGLVTISNQYGADGYYNGNSKITGNVANLNANNIKAGVNVGRFDGTAGITGTFTSDGTATANNLSNGATAYVNGQKITGNGTDVNNAWSSGHTAGYNEGYNATVKTVSGELLPEAGAINTVNCGFRPNRVFVYNMTRYSTYLYDIRIPHVMFGYVNGNWHPMSDYQDVLFEVLDNGFRFKSGYAYTGDKWIWMVSQ